MTGTAGMMEMSAGSKAKRITARRPPVSALGVVSKGVR